MYFIFRYTFNLLIIKILGSSYQYRFFFNDY
nr:MAG TPA: Bacterial transcriptional repressor [Caudoviricetes sp.]